MDNPAGAPLTRREAREKRASRSVLRRLSAPRPTRSARAARGPQILSLGALLVSGALVVAMSVPANAFLGDSASASLVGPVSSSPRPGQSLAVSDSADLQAPTRDSFGTTSYAEQLRLKYAGYGGTFAATTGSIRWPFPYTVPITDGFGLRPAWISGQPQHNGVDFTPGAGSPIYAIADGVVTFHLEEQGGFGNNVIIQHDIPGQNVESLYAHMQSGSSPLVVGEAVKVGDFIGLVGDTGNSYGAHLHLEIHLDKVPVDPFAWLQANTTN